MSRLQRKIWQIPWLMWNNCNEILHNNHTYELQAIDKEIQEEYSLGIHNLNIIRYQHLFATPLPIRLKQSLTSKQKWLSSIWATRDKLPDTQPQTRNHIALAFFNRWKQRIQHHQQQQS